MAIQMLDARSVARARVRRRAAPVRVATPTAGAWRLARWVLCALLYHGVSLRRHRVSSKSFATACASRG